MGLSKDPGVVRFQGPVETGQLWRGDRHTREPSPSSSEAKVIASAIARALGRTPFPGPTADEEALLAATRRWNEGLTGETAQGDEARAVSEAGSLTKFGGTSGVCLIAARSDCKPAAPSMGGRHVGAQSTVE